MGTSTRILVGALCALPLAFAGDVSAQTPQRGGTGIFTVTQDPPTLNPNVSSGVPDHQVGCIIYEGLIEVSPDYKVLPLLAKSWTVSPDGLTYSFDLIQTNWTDGKPLTSEDVRFSIVEVAAKYSPTFAPAGRVLDKVETPAPDKVVIKLKQPFGPFFEALTCQQGSAILPSHLMAGTNVLQNPASLDKPVGTGSFTLSEWKRGDYIRLKRNDKYHVAGKPYLDEIVAKVITSAAARIQALQAGEVDQVRGLSPNEQRTVASIPKLKVVVNDVSPSMDQIFFNTIRKPFDDRRVRQALMMAVDRDYIFKNAFFNIGKKSIQPFTTDIEWYRNPDIDYDKMYPYDPKRAEALLDEVGLKRGSDGKRFPLKLLTYANDYPEFMEVAGAMKSMYLAIGVDATVESQERASLLKRVFQDKDFDMSFQNYASNYDPALGMAKAYVTAQIGLTFGNAGSYSNPEVDELFVKGQGGTTFDERAKYYREVQAILARDVPIFHIHQRRSLDGASVRLQGVWGKVQSTGGNWVDAWLSKE